MRSYINICHGFGTGQLLTSNHVYLKVQDERYLQKGRDFLYFTDAADLNAKIVRVPVQSHSINCRIVRVTHKSMTHICTS